MALLGNLAKHAVIVSHNRVHFTVPKALDSGGPGTLEVSDEVASGITKHAVVRSWMEAGTFAIKGTRAKASTSGEPEVKLTEPEVKPQGKPEGAQGSQKKPDPK